MICTSTVLATANIPMLSPKGEHGVLVVGLLEETLHVVLKSNFLHLREGPGPDLVVVDLLHRHLADDGADVQPVVGGRHVHLLQLLVVDVVGLLEISQVVQVEVELIPELLVLLQQPLLLPLHRVDLLVELAHDAGVHQHDGGEEDADEDGDDDDEAVHD